jgi:hypothetical protein
MKELNGMGVTNEKRRIPSGIYRSIRNISD